MPELDKINQFDIFLTAAHSNSFLIFRLFSDHPRMVNRTRVLRTNLARLWQPEHDIHSDVPVSRSPKHVPWFRISSHVWQKTSLSFALDSGLETLRNELLRRSM